MLRPDHQADIGDTGVAQCAEHVVEKRPADRDHSLDAMIRGARLFRIELRALVIATHPGSQPARKDHRARNQLATSPDFQIRGSSRASPNDAAMKIAAQSHPMAVRPYRKFPVPNSAA